MPKAHIVLISGSGAQDRNSDLLGHKSFLLLSDKFTKAGFAVLRVDDRGAGKSGGNYNQSRLTDFQHDTEAAIEFIVKENKGKPKIFLIGHSLGGIIGPKIAQERSDVHAVIALAGPTMRGDQLMLLQKELIEVKMGYPEQMVKPGIENFKKLYATLLQPLADMETAKKDLATTAKEIFPMLPENQLNMIVGQLTTPWLYDMIRLDPQDYLTKLTKPTLFIFGEKDLQVPPKENEALAKTYLTQAGNKHFETKIFPNLNHLFQNCDSGLPTEYGTIEETMAEEVIEQMLKWMEKNLNK
jgi:pimeloyl-ACP methyl ester carboxylesterase